MKLVFFFTIFINFVLKLINGYLVLDLSERLIKDKNDEKSFNNNTLTLNNAFEKISKNKGGKVIIPEGNYYFNGGVNANKVDNIIIEINGIMKFQDSRKLWPKFSEHYEEEELKDDSIFNLRKIIKKKSEKVKECIQISDSSNITITSSQERGIIDGQGKNWYGYLNYLIYGENRPRLLKITNSTQILLEKINLINSPYWTTYFYDVSEVEIRFSKIDARINNSTYHDLLNLGAFNTDGFDIAGKNIWVHNVEVWNQDDCLCVKQLNKNNFRAQCSENMLFENSTVSGVGLTIGSIGASNAETCVRNITFRNIDMPNTFKGIYVKSRPSIGTAIIKDIQFTNITISNPSQWPIWIGPQQAVYNGACSLTWPYFGECPVPSTVTFENIHLNDVKIKLEDTMLSKIFSKSPGVILSNYTNPIKNITFKNVVVEGNYKDYLCENTSVKIEGNTNPSPCNNI